MFVIIEEIGSNFMGVEEVLGWGKPKTKFQCGFGHWTWEDTEKASNLVPIWAVLSKLGLKYGYMRLI